MLKIAFRWQYVTEPVKVDDDGDIVGRHFKTADQRYRSRLREMNIASFSIQASPAVPARIYDASLM